MERQPSPAVPPRAADRGEWAPTRDHREFQFGALRPEPLAKLIVAAVVGPVGWVLAILLAILLVDATREIIIGVLATLASFAFAAVVLTVLHRGRDREEEDYRRRHGERAAASGDVGPAKAAEDVEPA